MPIAEMQARLFFEVLNGNVILPKWRAMQDNIRERKEKLQARYVKSPRHTIQANKLNKIKIFN